MSWAGCYSLVLMCSNGDECVTFKKRYRPTETEYTDELGAVCRRKAKARGWKIKKEGQCYCPPCVKAGNLSGTDEDWIQP